MTDFSRFDDLDPTETREWLESIDSVLGTQGPERAHFLLNQMIDFARRSGAYLPYAPNTAYLNTISTGRQPSNRAGLFRHCCSNHFSAESEDLEGTGLRSQRADMQGCLALVVDAGGNCRRFAGRFSSHQRLHLAALRNLSP